MHKYFRFQLKDRELELELEKAAGAFKSFIKQGQKSCVDVNNVIIFSAITDQSKFACQLLIYLLVSESARESRDKTTDVSE